MFRWDSKSQWSSLSEEGWIWKLCGWLYCNNRIIVNSLITISFKEKLVYAFFLITHVCLALADTPMCKKLYGRAIIRALSSNAGRKAREQWFRTLSWDGGRDVGKHTFCIARCRKKCGITMTAFCIVKCRTAMIASHIVWYRKRYGTTMIAFRIVKYRKGCKTTKISYRIVWYRNKCETTTISCRILGCN